MYYIAYSVLYSALYTAWYMAGGSLHFFFIHGGIYVKMVFYRLLTSQRRIFSRTFVIEENCFVQFSFSFLLSVLTFIIISPLFSL
ncbi:uncharacterized protein RJT20DRAFT_7673 [Scheffersomyces xylosifermentans]|uniref:uncharacterized protein n=1 Tax=Scheffersomyces xylosifermentans TaxID=1304137 RepID=UPI00315D2A7E